MRGNYRHGMRHSRIYNIWRSMGQRCSNPNNNRYSVYGGRGIVVCAEWKYFIGFYEWSISNGYNDGLTIDRINPNGNYEPNNCRWVTQKVQQNNRNNNRYIEFNGNIHTLGEWSEITGINLGTIWDRLKRGWSIEKTLTTTPITGNNQFSALGGKDGNTNRQPRKGKSNTKNSY